ncbi:hypothetical protein KUD11_04840 [Roseovarius sp. LXJ103]|nr:hypothetical protein [Roseovarius carneus]MBZ8117968.1 hypothetical protein [Roseovarius carneus]
MTKTESQVAGIDVGITFTDLMKLNPDCGVMTALSTLVLIRHDAKTRP